MDLARLASSQEPVVKDGAAAAAAPDEEEDPEEAAAAKRQRLESQRQAGATGKPGAAEQARGSPFIFQT